ncbi:MAG: carboxymuconolactone decarboxylase family protein [Spirochaetia bacterium]|jgi:alkylhydroperoxidase/carboxymuconolactone decarboxylase family protein YurZ|nr:carboxymuconolactone decarboxylase family protein [Spirochaetia bacterium]
MNPLEVIKELDSELFYNVGNTGKLSLEDGALSKKHKLLIALALDAAHGASDGVHSLAMQAIANGATKEEIMETIRVSNFISGVGSVYTAAQGLKGLF